MRRTLFIVGLFVCAFVIEGAGYAQEIDSSVAADFRMIVNLMLSGNAEELSKYIVYPLHRQNPLPDISNRKQFIAKFPMLIDSAFKEQLKHYSDSDIFEHHDAFGLVGGGFSGEIWIQYQNGLKVTRLNLSSEAEEAFRKELIAKQKSLMHPSIRNWDENILVARTKNLLIRLDLIDTSVRYASWSKGKSQSDKPDLVIANGVEEAQGSQGGITWTFKNNGYTYVVEDSQLGKDESDIGYFLTVSKGDKVLSTSRLELIK